MADDFIRSFGVAIMKAGTCPLLLMGHIFCDMMSGFLADCSGGKSVDEEEEEEESQPQQDSDNNKHTLQKKAETALAHFAKKNSGLNLIPPTPSPTSINMKFVCHLE